MRNTLQHVRRCYILHYNLRIECTLIYSHQKSYDAEVRWNFKHSSSYSIADVHYYIGRSVIYDWMIQQSSLHIRDIQLTQYIWWSLLIRQQSFISSLQSSFLFYESVFIAPLCETVVKFVLFVSSVWLSVMGKSHIATLHKNLRSFILK